MSSLLQHSYCSSSSLTSRSSSKLNFFPISRIPASQNAVRCNLVEPLKYENGKPYTPYLSSSTTTDQATTTTTTTTTTAPSISNAPHSENAHDTRLRIFSGTANPALSQ
ncbi:ribose-phosphate pyrophosphokinase 2, partial [Quercus suber]